MHTNQLFRHTVKHTFHFKVHTLIAYSLCVWMGYGDGGWGYELLCYDYECTKNCSTFQVRKQKRLKDESRSFQGIDLLVLQIRTPVL